MLIEYGGDNAKKIVDDDKLKDVYGKLPPQVELLIRKRRIDTACELLVSTNHTISDLAATLNFSSTSHFARCFKAFTKVSPLEYKNKYFSKTNL